MKLSLNNGTATHRSLAQHAFSLVELLVVIAITSILLGLLFGPIISSFNLTRRARSISQAQDAARFGLERLSRELARATYIYDNGLAPVAIPMNYATVPTPSGNIAIGGVGANIWPTVAYGRIDLVQPAVRQNAGDVIDPTNGLPVGGAELQPGVRGKRVTRYFLGLRNPRNADGSQRFYENLYEFRRADNNLNPVILYRAEYDPSDPNLFDVSSTAAYNSTAANSGGFNDPAFFYATGPAANGRPYGANWQAIAQPVIVSDNLDLLRWNRAGKPTERDFKDANDPFGATTTFTPVAVPDDIAAPGFLTSGGVETPAAVPTVYQTKYGAWTYPYTVTVLRGSTNFGGVRPEGEPFGMLKMTVSRDGNGIISVSPPDATTATGTLATLPATLYTILSPTSRKLFVKTPNLTFSIDPDRGRVETAFPPLLGGANGVPSHYTVANPPTIASAVAGTVPANGEVIPTRFVQDTRDPNAGTGAVPANQGILSVNLFDVSATRYQLAAAALTSGTPLGSPLIGFGNATGTARLRGVRVIPGSERVTASTSVGGIPTAWARVGAVPAAGGDGKLQSLSSLTASVPQFYDKIPERSAQYQFNFDEYPADQNALAFTQLVFDFNSGVLPTTATELQAKAASGLPAADTNGQNFVAVTYLWQNNFSRDQRDASATFGNPMDAGGRVIRDFLAMRPEADVFRVDYATRQQYNINLGARIYDPTDGQASSIQVTDKVIINNALR